MALAGELFLPDIQAAGEKENRLQICEAIRKAAHALRAPAGVAGSQPCRKREAARPPLRPGPNQTAPEDRTKTAPHLRPGQRRSACDRPRRSGELRLTEPLRLRLTGERKLSLK